MTRIIAASPVILLMASLVSGAEDEDESAGSGVARWHEILAAMRSNHEKVQSGEFQAVDTEEDSRAQEKKVVADVYMAFDRRTKRERFDYIVRQQQAPNATAAGGMHPSTFCRIVSPEEYIVFRAQLIDLMNPKQGGQQQQWFSLDYRILGLANGTVRTPTTFDEQMTALEKFRNVTVAPADADGAEVVTIQFEAGKLTIERKIWCGAKQGSLPVRLEMRYRNSPTEQWRLSDTVTTKWEQRGDVFVPQQCIVEVTYPGAKRRDEWSIAWKSINQDLAESTFDYLSFPRNGKHVAVLDARTTPGHGVITTAIHADGTVQKLRDPPSPPREPGVAHVERWWSPVVFVGGVAFLLAVAYRKFRQQ